MLRLYRRRETTKGLERILDELLVLRSQDGDVAAFENLARSWQPRLLRLARRLTQSPEAGEVVQEAWLAIVRGLPRLADPARFGTWAFRIVAHKSTDWIRLRQKGRSPAERVESEPQPEGPPSTEEEVSREPPFREAAFIVRCGQADTTGALKSEIVDPIWTPERIRLGQL